MFDMMNKTLGDLDPKQLGVFIFLALAGLTIVEFIFGTGHAPGFLMWLLAFMKVGLVLIYFMHLPRLFGSDEGDHK